MRAWVTGGSGFIGGRLVKRLTEEEWDVWVWPEILILPTVYHNRKPDVIFHLAAVTRNAPSIKDPLRTMHVNVYGSALVFDLAKQLGVPVVYASSNVVYSDVVTPYYISKKAADEYALWLVRRGQTIAILRFSDVYGAGMRSGLFHTWRRQYRAHGAVELWGGDQTRDYIHVDDVVEAMMLSVGKVVYGVDICTGKQTSFREVARLLGVPTVNMGLTFGAVSRCLDQYSEAAYEAIGFEAKTPLKQGLEEIRKEWGLTTEEFIS